MFFGSLHLKFRFSASSLLTSISHISLRSIQFFHVFFDVPQTLFRRISILLSFFLHNYLLSSRHVHIVHTTVIFLVLEKPSVKSKTCFLPFSFSATRPAPHPALCPRRWWCRSPSSHSVEVKGWHCARRRRRRWNSARVIEALPRGDLWTEGIELKH